MAGYFIGVDRLSNAAISMLLFFTVISKYVYVYERKYQLPVSQF